MQALDEELFAISAAARELGCSASLLRLLDQTGEIPRARRIAGRGDRVWTRREVEQIRQIRAARTTAMA